MESVDDELTWLWKYCSRVGKHVGSYLPSSTL